MSSGKLKEAEATRLELEGASIRLEQVTKRYDGVAAPAVDHVDLEIAPGEFIVLVGPSGSGKSTLLRMIAGLESTTEGAISVAGRDVTDLGAGKRDVAMVFQNYALYPHMNVRRNLGFALRVQHVGKQEIKRRVDKVAQALGLEDLLERKPAALSGGQRQRVAIGRAIVREPAVFLMDEPLSNLDARLRVEMRAELVRLHRRLGVTTIFVTHDQAEALTLGQRVVVLRSGRLQQCAPPQQLYDDPINLFVASFIGSPAMNLVDAQVVGTCVRFADQRLPIAGSSLATLARSDFILGIRPGDIALAPERLPQGASGFRATIDTVERRGESTVVTWFENARPVETDMTRDAFEDSSDGDSRLLADDQRVRFSALLGGRAPVHSGLEVSFVVDMSRLYAFDPVSGRALTEPPAASTRA